MGQDPYSIQLLCWHKCSVCRLITNSKSSAEVCAVSKWSVLTHCVDFASWPCFADYGSSTYYSVQLFCAGVKCSVHLMTLYHRSWIHGFYNVELLCVHVFKCVSWSFDYVWQIVVDSVELFVCWCMMLSMPLLPCITDPGTRCTLCSMAHQCPVTRTRNTRNLWVQYSHCSSLLWKHASGYFNERVSEWWTFSPVSLKSFFFSEESGVVNLSKFLFEATHPHT